MVWTVLKKLNRWPRGLLTTGVFLADGSKAVPQKSQIHILTYAYIHMHNLISIFKYIVNRYAAQQFLIHGTASGYLQAETVFLASNCFMSIWERFGVRK